MNDENLIQIDEFNVKLDGTEVELVSERLNRLKSLGFTEINFVLSTTDEKLAGINGIDTGIFENIRKIQSLPAKIVIDFMKIKGSWINKASE
jgi:hypothetical protein